MPYVAASADVGTAGDHHRSFIRSSLQHAVTAGLAHHRTVSIKRLADDFKAQRAGSQVVGIIFGPTALMDQTGIRSLVAQHSVRILDLVQWVKQVSIWKPCMKTSILTRCKTTFVNKTSSLRSVGAVCICSRVQARVFAEIRRLIHINPSITTVISRHVMEGTSKNLQCVNIYTVGRAEEGSKFVVPIALSTLVKPVGKSSHAWPDLTLI